MLGLTQPGNVPVDAYVIRRICKNEIGRSSGQHPPIVGFTARVATEQAMRSENPKVASARYRSLFIRGKKIFWTGLGGAFLGGVAKNAVDLAEGKSREFRIIELHVQQTLQLHCKNVTIP